MFGNVAYRLPTIRDYRDALHTWAHAHVWRDSREEYDLRGLLGRRMKHYTVRKASDQSIVFRLHNTDVITIYPDNTLEFELTHWPTILTTAFFHGLMPSHLRYYASAGCLQVGDRWYRLTSPVKLGRDTEGRQVMLTSTPRFFTHRLNRKAWNVVLKHYKIKQLEATLTTFADAVGVEACARSFAEICSSMTELPPHVFEDAKGLARRYTVAGYSVISTRFVERVIDSIQIGLLRFHLEEVVTTTTKPYLTSEQEFAAWMRSKAKYGA